MKVLITGITGMAGSHLAEYLLHSGQSEVHGVLRWRSNRENIAFFENDLQLHECELRDPFAVAGLLHKLRPERIYHLASQSSVAVSFVSPRETLVNNVTAQLNILEAMRSLRLEETRLLTAGSSEEYGMVEAHELPVKESTPLRPLSPYAVSKVTQDAMAYQYHRSYGLHVVRTRAFNHTGPRRSDVFVTSNFARQIAEIEAGLRDPVIRVGNLEAKRDFSDIRDVVRAYVLALEQGEAGEVYNIGSGKPHSISKVLEMLLGMSRCVIRIEQDPSRMRPSDIPVLVADTEKFRRKTGWRPRWSLEESLSDLLNSWRERIATGKPAQPLPVPTHGAARRRQVVKA
ncbi:MAG: GDP-mannose 4,6-dehydratase [Deltaproteobacteria bacterium]|nr:GDP-mannose 4,6-dehydratase [Deltaproteobacteria bacterium]MBW2346517.1 GDP-mannose 4,6-dehydratase [Deltaproteobacteria bacterium]